MVADGAPPARTGEAPPPSTPKCPECGRPAPPSGEAFPFCGKRCRTLDLGRWASEAYRISRPIEQQDLEEA
jgi:endogenous inhibitor of DNA gyrase (YacG/DUF329 family)